ncbi:MAG: hypothetical protein COA43_12730 [Robiginitomaculum sp.]|nr:MAG: hypothetical protein COA43_12730 [Robiginitomaculum sp.]
MPTAFHNYHHPSDVLHFIACKYETGIACALILVTDITGGTLRAKGALMAVCENGESAGYISSGCVDGDIITRAQHALSLKTNTHIRYGEGSPFKDIQLPCGGSIEIFIATDCSQNLIIKLSSTLNARQSIGVNIWGDVLAINDTPEITFRPKLRLRIVGRGMPVINLAQQALHANLIVHVQSPDAEMKALLPTHTELSFEHLISPTSPPPCFDDHWTAIVLMFHDHEWEGDILKQALRHDGFYIGALGSLGTHANRCEVLQNLGVSPDEIAKISAPIGLIPSMRDANLLAISTLAEIISTAQKRGRL